MMKIAITVAALLTAVGSGAALAQGAPPGFAPWQSGWSSYIEPHQAPVRSARGASTMRSDRSAAAARQNGSVPVAGNGQSIHRRG